MSSSTRSCPRALSTVSSSRSASSATSAAPSSDAGRTSSTPADRTGGSLSRAGGATRRFTAAGREILHLGTFRGRREAPGSRPGGDLREGCARIRRRERRPRGRGPRPQTLLAQSGASDLRGSGRRDRGHGRDRPTARARERGTRPGLGFPWWRLPRAAPDPAAEDQRGHRWLAADPLGAPRARHADDARERRRVQGSVRAHHGTRRRGARDRRRRAARLPPRRSCASRGRCAQPSGRASRP